MSEMEVESPQSNEEVDVTPDLDGGVLKLIEKYGEGSTPSNGSKVNVHYEGKLTTGHVFDSSWERGEPFEFELGKGTVIKGWDIGVATMKVGERAKFTIKPEYAYGKSGSPPKIPPDTTLIFDIEMLGWKAEDLSPKKDGSILRSIVEPGEGYTSPNDGATVTIHLVGKYGDKIFDDRTVKFSLGEGNEYDICPAIEKALEKFKNKEKSTLDIKSKYAFGSKGSEKFGIPPNADVQYTVTLLSFEKLKESWALSSTEKLVYAKIFKDKGTRYFKQEKYFLAIKMYKRVKEYVQFETGFSGEEEKERFQLNVAALLNLALCYLKLKDYLNARNICDEVLEIDCTNEKALYRRGQAQLGLAEPERAKASFEKLLTIDKGNKQVEKYVVACNELIKKHKEQEKRIYANMFEKFAKHDKQKEEEQRKREPDVMNTLGEWGEDEREHEPTEFEKENPNILMLDGTGDFKNM